MENNLPEGWVEKDLSEIVTYKKGKKPKRMESVRFPDSLVYLDIKAIEKGNDEIFVDKASSNHTNENDLIVVWDGARAGWVGKSRKGAIGSTIMSLTPKINRDYLYRFLQTQFDYIQSNHRGTGIPHVDPLIFWNIKVPVAPLPEQDRIVAKLDAIMQKVEANKQRLEKIPKLLKRFRQAVLAAAVSGKLTEEWREENSMIESAEQLLSKVARSRSNSKVRKLAEIDNLSDLVLPESWKWCQLDEIAALVTDGKHGDCNDESNSGYYFLSAKDISGGILNYNNARQIVYEEFLETHRRTNLEAGDICVVNTGATVGKSAIATVNDLTARTTFQKSVAVIKLFKELNPKYVNYIIQLESPKILLKSGGSAINNWLLSEMRAFWCQLPPTLEQDEIVSQVEILFAFADKIETRYTKAKGMLDRLPQSVLGKAFRGELS